MAIKSRESVSGNIEIGRVSRKEEPAIAPALLGIREAGHYLGLSRTSVYDLMSKGEISSIKIGTRTLVCVDSLQALIARSAKNQLWSNA